MHALSSDANMVVISPTNLTGNVIQALEQDFASNPTAYPQYTSTSFSEMLTKCNIIQIMSDIEGAKYGLTGDANGVTPPLSIYGGTYIYGAETIRKIYVGACQVILYIKPTP